METLDFDALTPTVVQVKYGGKIYILREADGDAEMAWRDAGMSAAKLGPEGHPERLTGLAQTDVTLLQKCLYHANAAGEMPTDKDGKPDKTKLVAPQTIRGFQHRVMQDLYDKLIEISRMQKKETVEELEKQKAKLQKKIDDLKAKTPAAQEEARKNSSTNGEGGSELEPSLVSTPSS